MWRSAIRARLSKRIEQFSSAWGFFCSFKPLFLKTVDGQYNAVNIGSLTELALWASVEDDLNVQNRANTHLRPDKQKSLRVARIGVFFFF